MGEKLLAQRVLTLLRDTYGKSSPVAGALLEWAAEQRDWLWPKTVWAVPATDTESAKDGETIDWDSLARLADSLDVSAPFPDVFDTVSTALNLLDLKPFDHELVFLTAAFERLPRLVALASRLRWAGGEMAALIGQLAGAPAASSEALVRRAKAIELGLICVKQQYSSPASLELEWRFADVIDQAFDSEDQIVAALAGTPQPASLARDDFAHLDRDFDLLARLLTGALRNRAQGVNILIHGPPGTGKTEFARTLASEIGARLFAVGEMDDRGEEPSRWERLCSLNRAARLLHRRSDSLILFDEMEDLFSESSTAASGERRAGSKIFVNRLLEQMKVPVIWTSNSLEGIDRAHLRRMNYVLRMGYPSAAARERIATRSAASAGAAETVEGLKPFLLSQPDSASVAPIALRTAALAGGGARDAAAVEGSLLQGLRGGRRLAPARWSGELDLSLYDADICIADVVERLTRGDAPADFSLLLSGPPGTGKTALAADVARRLDRPLAVKRASDLLSKWVGGTEENIAEAFADAREEGAVLLFDEADSLLLDRSDARMSWEITQVNELLTWMDSHPLPFIAATNFARRLDPAVFRRFLFKVELRPLSEGKLDKAFERFFGGQSRPELREIVGLTPGDFAVVKRQLRYRTDCTAKEIVELLRREAEAKPGPTGRIGF
ncbi:AAA family ATPase [Sphingomonas daechungensis]|uniref:AAA family ATPase n=1 Tax=Sphingomonas daechungensis TaxID=1176646 RepID=A0ABX6T1T1_9SPHN|nr:AAA family ATPase [Sphingomonas daechungensis]QNP43807.1 AAA family ATPase [Sphingomonas daechungensis]